MKRRSLIVVVAFILVLVAALFRLHSLNQKPSDPTSFTWVNKAEVYALGLVMAALAYPIYPEVAREHLSLYFENDGQPTRIENDFFLRSAVVQQTIERAKASGAEQRLYWPMASYTLSLNSDDYWEARVALALNGGYLRLEDDKVIARVPIAYPKRALAPLVRIPGLGTLSVQEGLFWVLQQEGWYHTGTIEWVARPPASR